MLVVVTHALLTLVAQSDDVPISREEAATLCTFDPALDQYTCGSDAARARLRFAERVTATNLDGVTVSVRALDLDGCVRAVAIVATSTRHTVAIAAHDARLQVDDAQIALEVRQRAQAAAPGVIASAAFFVAGRDPADREAACIAPTRLDRERERDELVLTLPVLVDGAVVPFEWHRTRAWIDVPEAALFSALPEPPRPAEIERGHADVHADVHGDVHRTDRERALIREGLRRRHAAWTRMREELPLEL